MFGLADKTQGHGRGGGHMEVGEKTGLREHGRGEEIDLVDDDAGWAVAVRAGFPENPDDLPARRRRCDGPGQGRTGDRYPGRGSGA